VRSGPLKTYAVTTRKIGGPIRELLVEAEDSFIAHQQVRWLHPDLYIVRIALAPPNFDGEDW